MASEDGHRSYVVEPREGRWVVLRSGGPVLSKHATQQHAIDAAKRRAAQEWGAVTWKSRDGSVQDMVDYRPHGARQAAVSRTVPRKRA